MGQTLEEFLADESVPRETRELVKSRLDPDPPWEPGPDDEAPADAAPSELDPEAI